MRARVVMACAAAALLLGLYQLARVTRPAPAAPRAVTPPSASPEIARAIVQAREEAAQLPDAAPLPPLPDDLPRPGLPAESPPLVGGASKAPPPVP